MHKDDNNYSHPGRNLGKGMTIAAWVMGLVVLTLFFQNREDNAINPNQNPVSHEGAGGIQEVVLEQNRYGHYVVTGAINLRPAVFMVDTGASEVSIPENLAQGLNLEYGPQVKRVTANGTIEVYLTNLKQLSIGNIELYNVRATINPYSRDSDILLGMSVLKRLEFTQRGSALTLRQYPNPIH